MRLRDVMSVEVITVGADDPASIARATMRQHRIRHPVVMEDGRLVGIVSERDLGGAEDGINTRPLRSRFDGRRSVSASPATTLRQAANLMRGRTVGCLLVVEDGRVVGIVTTTDLLDQLGRGRPARPCARNGHRCGDLLAAAWPEGRRRPARQLDRGEADALDGRLRGDLRYRRQCRVRPNTFGDGLRSSRRGHIRVFGATLDSRDRDDIARKLGMRLGKFATSIERVTVRLSDVNGPKGGVRTTGV